MIRGIPAIRIAAGAVLIVGGLLAALFALNSVGIALGGREDVEIDLSRLMQSGQYHLSVMAFVIVNAAAVMGLLAPGRNNRLQGAALWLVLAGATVFLVQIAAQAWYTARLAAMPRRAYSAYYDAHAADDGSGALILELFNVMQVLMIAAVVALIAGWTLWLAVWLHGRVRRP